MEIEFEDNPLGILLMLDDLLIAQFLDFAVTENKSSSILFLMEADIIRFKSHHQGNNKNNNDVIKNNGKIQSKQMKRILNSYVFKENDTNENDNRLSNMLTNNELDGLIKLIDSAVPLRCAFNVLCDRVFKSMLKLSRSLYILPTSLSVSSSAYLSSHWSSIQRSILSLQPTKYELVSILNNKSNKKYFQNYLEENALQSDLSCLQCWITVKKLLTDLLVYKNINNDLNDSNNNKNAENFSNNNNSSSSSSKKSGRFVHSLAAARSASRAIFGSGAVSKTDVNLKATNNNTSDYNDPIEAFKVLLGGVRILKKKFFSATTISNLQSSQSSSNKFNNLNNEEINSCSGLSETVRIELAAILALTSSIRIDDIESVDPAFILICASRLEKMICVIERESFQYLQILNSNFLKSVEYTLMIANNKAKELSNVKSIMVLNQFLDDFIIKNSYVCTYRTSSNTTMYLNYHYYRMEQLNGDNKFSGKIFIHYKDSYNSNSNNNNNNNNSNRARRSSSSELVQNITNSKTSSSISRRSTITETSPISKRKNKLELKFQEVIVDNSGLIDNSNDNKIKDSNNNVYNDNDNNGFIINILTHINPNFPILSRFSKINSSFNVFDTSVWYGSSNETISNNIDIDIDIFIRKILDIVAIDELLLKCYKGEYITELDITIDQDKNDISIKFKDVCINILLQLTSSSKLLFGLFKSIFSHAYNENNTFINSKNSSKNSSSSSSSSKELPTSQSPIHMCLYIKPYFYPVPDQKNENQSYKNNISYSVAITMIQLHDKCSNNRLIPSMFNGLRSVAGQSVKVYTNNGVTTSTTTNNKNYSTNNNEIYEENKIKNSLSSINIHQDKDKISKSMNDYLSRLHNNNNNNEIIESLKDLYFTIYKDSNSLHRSSRNNLNVFQIEKMKLFISPVSKFLGVSDFSMSHIIKSLSPRLCLYILMLALTNNSIVLLSSSPTLLSLTLLTLPRLCWPFRLLNTHTLSSIISVEEVERWWSNYLVGNKLYDQSIRNENSSNYIVGLNSDSYYSSSMNAWLCDYVSPINRDSFDMKRDRSSSTDSFGKECKANNLIVIDIDSNIVIFPNQSNIAKDENNNHHDKNSNDNNDEDDNNNNNNNNNNSNKVEKEKKEEEKEEDDDDNYRNKNRNFHDNFYYKDIVSLNNDNIKKLLSNINDNILYRDNETNLLMKNKLNLTKESFNNCKKDIELTSNNNLEYIWSSYFFSILLCDLPLYIFHYPSKMIVGCDVFTLLKDIEEKKNNELKLINQLYSSNLIIDTITNDSDNALESSNSNINLKKDLKEQLIIENKIKNDVEFLFICDIIKHSSFIDLIERHGNILNKHEF